MRGCLDNGPILGRDFGRRTRNRVFAPLGVIPNRSRFSVQEGRGRISPADPKLVPPGDFRDLVTIGSFPWHPSILFALSATNCNEFRPRRSLPSPTTRSLLRCRNDTTPPAPIILCASFWGDANLGTTRTAMFTPGPPPTGASGERRESSGGIPPPRFTFIPTPLLPRRERSLNARG